MSDELQPNAGQSPHNQGGQQPTPPSSNPPVPAQPATPAELSVEERLVEFFQAHVSPAESPMERAISEAFDNNHLTQLLDFVSLRERNRHAEAMAKSRNRPWVVIAIIGIFLLFIILFGWVSFAYGQGSILLPVVTTLIAMIGAAVGAFSWGRMTSNKEEPPQPNNPS